MALYSITLIVNNALPEYLGRYSFELIFRSSALALLHLSESTHHYLHWERHFLLPILHWDHSLLLLQLDLFNRNLLFGYTFSPTFRRSIPFLYRLNCIRSILATYKVETWKICWGAAWQLPPCQQCLFCNHKNFHYYFIMYGWVLIFF